MSDSLRDRIAAALYEDGQRPMATAVRLADAVIADLGLRQQGLRGGFFLVAEPPWDKWRYVTEWEADE